MSADGGRARRDLGPELGALLGHGPLDGGALHLALVVDDDARVVLEVDPDALAAPPGLLLADDHALQHLLPQLRLALLAGAEDHVARRAVGHLVQAPADADDGHDVEVLRAAVVRAIHERGHAQAEGHPELAAALAAAPALHGRCGGAGGPAVPGLGAPRAPGG